MENTSISSNIKHWENEIQTTKENIKKLQSNVISLTMVIEMEKDSFTKMVYKRNKVRMLSEINSLNYALKEMRKNLNFWLWVNKNFGEGYEETFSHPMEDDE